MTDLRATFVMEQHLGHRTFYENLRSGVEGHPDVQARWVEVSYADTTPWGRLPGLGVGLRGALRGRAEARRGAAADDHVRFFNTQVPAVLGGRAVRNRPYVLCTDVTPVQYDAMAEGYAHVADRGGPVARAKNAINRRVFRGAAVTVAWSSWARDSIVGDYGVDPARTAVIAPGVDTRRWTPGQRRSDGPMTVLFVGGDLMRKGGETLLAALAGLPQGVARAVLVTRTPHPPGPDLDVRTDLRPNSSELIALFRSSDVFVLPSAAETFGIAAVEAAAAGLPIIASRVGGLADLVVDGQTGRLVEPGDVAALRAALLTMAEHPEARRRMGAAARTRAERSFDAVVNAGRIVDLLRTAAHPRP